MRCRALSSLRGLALLSALLLSSVSWAQLYTGSISGTVSDPTGAVVPNVKVTITDVTRGFTFSSVTDASGAFTVRNLPPSTYNLRAEAAGFNPFTRENITLNVNQNASLPIEMTVAGDTQTVQVVEGAPLVQTEDASTGQTVNRTFINDLPLAGRAVFDLARLAPGVSEPRGNGGWSNNFVSQGSRNATADVLLDGVSTVAAEQNGNFQMPLYQPSVDSVQEFRVQQSGFSAEFGFSGSTVVNMVTRSGTNEFHGSLYEFLRNEKMNANNFFNNSGGVARPTMRWNQFGATAGGRIIRDRLFFFANYQGTRERRAQTWRAGVPSAAMRTGNFGEICTAGFDASGRCTDASQQLWDPYVATWSTALGGPVRTQFIPFNNIGTYVSPGAASAPLPQRPGNLIDPVGQRVMNLFPLPNLNVGTSSYNPFSNWIGAASNANTGDQIDGKLDFRLSDNDMLSGKVAWGRSNSSPANCYPNALDPCSVGPGIGGPRLAALNWTHTFSPTTLLTASLGSTRSYQDRPGVGGQFPDYNYITELGLPSYMSASGLSAAPTIYINNYAAPAGNANIGGQGWGIMRYASEVHHLIGSVSNIRGRHEIRAGGEARLHRINFRQAGYPGGLPIFQNNSTSQNPSSGGGDPMAGLLIGFPGAGQWGGVELPLYTSTSAWKYAGFIQDNWRATDKLTLNLGVRYDIEMPRTERYNRMNYIDLTAASPISVPGMTLTGAPVFTSEDMRTQFDRDTNNIAPRVGFAYQVTPGFVARGGYGIFYLPSAVGAAGTGAGGFMGFQQVTPWLAFDPRIPQSTTPFATLSNPAPLGIIPPPSRQELTSSYNLGRSISGPIRGWSTTPYEQTWSLSLQHELPWRSVIEAAYIGKKGTNLYWGGLDNVNFLPQAVAQEYMQGRSSFWNEQVPNPFQGLITDPNSSLGSATIARNQLTRAFPQYEGVNGNAPPWANSFYHGLQLRFEKRLSEGLQFLTTYVFSKSIDDTSSSGSNTDWLGAMATAVQDPYNRRLERSISLFDQTHQFQFSWVYGLPFGKGRLWGGSMPGFVQAVLGGWQLNGIYRWTSGFPVALSLANGQSVPTFGAQRPNLNGTLQKAENWQDTLQFFANPGVVTKPDPFAIGTAPRALSNIRWPGTNNMSASLFKQFNMSRLREGTLFELRLETFNTLNYVQFCGPNSTQGSGSFGAITSQCNSPRELQLGARFYF